jgi:hypothetical protein
MTIHRHHRRRRLSSIRPLGLFRIQNLFFITYESIGQLVWLLGRGIGPTQGLYLHRTTQHRKMPTHIRTSSRIRTHHPSVRAAENSTCLRPLVRWDTRHWSQRRVATVKYFRSGSTIDVKYPTPSPLLCIRECISISYPSLKLELPATITQGKKRMLEY